MKPFFSVEKDADSGNEIVINLAAIIRATPDRYIRDNVSIAFQHGLCSTIKADWITFKKKLMQLSVAEILESQ